MDFSRILILRDIDFSDPKQRKNVIKVSAAGAFLVLVIAVCLIQNNRTRAGEGTEAEQQPEYELPDLPEGNDNDRLEGKTLRDILASGGSAPATAGDLFSDDDGQSDPLGLLAGDGGTGSSAGGDAPVPGRPGVYPERTPRGDVTGGEAREERTASERRYGSTEDRDARVRRRMIESGLDPDTGEPLGDAGAQTQLPEPPAARTAGAQEQGQDPQQDQEQPQETVPEVPKVRVRRSGGVSSLGGGDGRLGSGVGSLGDEDPYVTEDPSHPFKVKFAYDEKLSSGQRVTLRLCEDMVVEGVLIPENTHVFATCEVGDRLGLKVSSIKIGDRIFPLRLEAYDNDGARGLYCPQSASEKSRRRAEQEAGQIVGTAVQSAVSGYTGRIVSSGANLLTSRSGEVKVEVTAGYQFYLMQSN